MTEHPKAFRRWQADYRRHLSTRPDDYPWPSLSAEDKAREKAADEEWKAWHDAAVKGMRGPGRPAADTEELVSAGVWLVHLFPGTRRVCGLNDVLDELLACPVPAVRALVGKAKRKTLRNRLTPHNHDILLPEPDALMDAAGWAEAMDLPALPLELFADTVLAHVTFLRPSRIDPHERDGLVLARAIHDSGMADALPPEAQEALRRRLRRLAQLTDDELADLAGDGNCAAE